MISFYINESNKEVRKNGETVFRENNKYILKYPCDTSYECSNYYADFPPGYYFIELYGGSGGYYMNRNTSYIDPSTNECLNESVVKHYGGNTQCNKVNSLSGAGGYTSGIMYFHKTTRVYIAIGGQGQYLTGSQSYEDSLRPKGGYNGGGKGSLYSDGSFGGGGATDLRIDEDDLWHRVLVAGGGGASDNPTITASFRLNDDGSGGSGGGLIAQGFWINGVYNNEHIANQTFGFTFGNGENAMQNGSQNPNGVLNGQNAGDRAGAGGGWFGGFSSHNGNGGAGGGSSFAFSIDAEIPSGMISSTDGYYNKIDSQPYAFSRESNPEYIVRNPSFLQGIWAGNGKAVITVFYLHCVNSIQYKLNINLTSLFLFVIISK